MYNLSSRLRYRFPKSEEIQRTYSQAGQDLFVLSMLNGLEQGTYVEIGACKAEEMSNTALLERNFAWKGIGVEIVPEFVDEYNSQRINKSVLGDATTTDYVELLQEAGITDTVIDYLSCDCEPPSVTFKALQQVIGQGIKFAVITFEHDSYAQGDAIKIASRKFLQEHGYVLIASNISEQAQIHDFEDWWAHPDLVDPAFIELFKDDGDDIKFWAEYIFPC
jgi:hypothetical protein